MSETHGSLVAYLAAYDEHARRCAGNPDGPPGSGICAVLEVCARQFFGWPALPEAAKPPHHHHRTAHEAAPPPARRP